MFYTGQKSLVRFSELTVAHPRSAASVLTEKLTFYIIMEHKDLDIFSNG